jgi:hypothetical protein
VRPPAVRAAWTLLPVAGLLLAGPVRSVPPKGPDTVTAKIVVGRGKPGTATLVIRIDGRTFTAPEEPYAAVDDLGDGIEFDENDYPRTCHISPDRRWVYVERKGMRRVNLGYLYRVPLRGTRLEPVHLSGRRFDEAAWDVLARQAEVRFSSYIPDGHIIRFGRWSKDSRSLHFSLTGAGANGADVPELFGRYDVRTETFQLTRGPAISRRCFGA